MVLLLAVFLSIYISFPIPQAFRVPFVVLNMLLGAGFLALMIWFSVSFSATYGTYFGMGKKMNKKLAEDSYGYSEECDEIVSR